MKKKKNVLVRYFEGRRTSGIGWFTFYRSGSNLNQSDNINALVAHRFGPPGLRNRLIRLGRSSINNINQSAKNKKDHVSARLEGSHDVAQPMGNSAWLKLSIFAQFASESSLSVRAESRKSVTTSEKSSFARAKAMFFFRKLMNMDGAKRNGDGPPSRRLVAEAIDRRTDGPESTNAHNFDVSHKSLLLKAASDS